MSEGLTPEAKALIDTIVEQQEGGWKLTQNANDPDGGWTYAGVTAKEFGEVAFEGGEQKYPGPMQIDTFHSYMEDGLEAVKLTVYSIYYHHYYEPLHLAEMPASIRGPLFSCAVNCGLETAGKLLQETINNWWTGAERYPNKPDVLKLDGGVGEKTLAALAVTVRTLSPVGSATVLRTHLVSDFLKLWMLHYINLVQANAAAWVAYAAQYEGIKDSTMLKYYPPAIETWLKKKPTVNRAASLEGWFNRVEFWR